MMTTIRLVSIVTTIVLLTAVIGAQPQEQQEAAATVSAADAAPQEHGQQSAASTFPVVDAATLSLPERIIFAAKLVWSFGGPTPLHAYAVSDACRYFRRIATDGPVAVVQRSDDGDWVGEYYRDINAYADNEGRVWCATEVNQGETQYVGPESEDAYIATTLPLDGMPWERRFLTAASATGIEP